MGEEDDGELIKRIPELSSQIYDTYYHENVGLNITSPYSMGTDVFIGTYLTGLGEWTITYILNIVKVCNFNMADSTEAWIHNPSKLLVLSL